MIVADASAIVIAVTDTTERGAAVLDRLEEGVESPHLVDAEVGQAIRNLVRRRRLDPERAEVALVDAHRAVTIRVEHGELLLRAWELRDNLSFYDALYVAVAEAQDLSLLTADARLARASGPRCRIELV